MGRFPKLTEHQYKPLLTLVDYQEQKKRLVVYANSGGWQAELTPWGEDDNIVTSVDVEVLALWEHCGYVTVGGRPVGPGMLGEAVPSFQTLILREEALAYAKRMRKPWMLRSVLNALDELSPEIRAGVISLITAILTTLVLHWLGVRV
jgi:hypothetical protein